MDHKVKAIELDKLDASLGRRRDIREMVLLVELGASANDADSTGAEP